MRDLLLSWDPSDADDPQKVWDSRLDHVSRPRDNMDSVSLILKSIDSILNAKGRCNCLEVGGNRGEIFSQLLSGPAYEDVSYTVLEVPGKVAVFSKVHEAPRLRFVSSLKEAEGMYDVVAFTAVTEYVPNLLKYLSTLCVWAQYVVVTRCATASSTRIGSQGGVGNYREIAPGDLMVTMGSLGFVTTYAKVCYGDHSHYVFSR